MKLSNVIPRKGAKCHLCISTTMKCLKFFYSGSYEMNMSLEIVVFLFFSLQLYIQSDQRGSLDIYLKIYTQSWTSAVIWSYWFFFLYNCSANSSICNYVLTQLKEPVSMSNGFTELVVRKREETHSTGKSIHAKVQTTLVHTHTHTRLSPLLNFGILSGPVLWNAATQTVDKQEQACFDQSCPRWMVLRVHRVHIFLPDW